MKNLAIIGGGAAGLAAAVKVGMLARKRDVAVGVTVYEADDRVGKSILRSGNGRCNFSNSNVRANVFHNQRFVGDALFALECLQRPKEGQVIDFFVDWGLTWSEEAEGRLYPYSGKATTVLNVLRGACDDLGVALQCGCAVKQVDPPLGEGAPFTLRMEDGRLQRADAVIVACGGEVAKEMLPSGLPFNPQRPVLGPLNATLQLSGQQRSKKKNHNPLLNLNNIRVNCALTLLRGEKEVGYERGEALFRKYGVSGIAVFNLSRFAQPGDLLIIDVLPFVSKQDMESWLFTRRKRLAGNMKEGLTWETMLRGLLLPPVAQVVIDSAGATADQPFAKPDVPALAKAMKGITLQVDGIHSDEGQCQVRRGGFAVKCVDHRTCQVRSIPGLHIVGEALDIDAPCGGYNLHWAWCSGMLAAHSCIDYLFA